jgi:YHS domain-containing protein
MIFLLVIMFSFSAIGFAEEIDLKPQTVCPVMGGKIDKAVYVDYEGERIYFCCSSCKDEFLKEPEKYMKKIEDDHVLLEKSPQ